MQELCPENDRQKYCWHIVIVQEYHFIPLMVKINPKIIYYISAVHFLMSSNVCKYIRVCVSLLKELKKLFQAQTHVSRTKRKERPKIDKSYQFGNGHSTSRNNAVARWELRLTLIMRLVCQGTWRTGSPPYLCLHG